MWIVDAHRDDGKRYVVHADEKPDRLAGNNFKDQSHFSSVSAFDHRVPSRVRDASDDAFPRGVVAGSVRDEDSDCKMPAVGECDDADVVGRGGDAIARAARAGLVRHDGPSGQLTFDAPCAGD